MWRAVDADARALARSDACRAGQRFQSTFASWLLLAASVGTARHTAAWLTARPGAPCRDARGGRWNGEPSSTSSATCARVRPRAPTPLVAGGVLLAVCSGCRPSTSGWAERLLTAQLNLSAMRYTTSEIQGLIDRCWIACASFPASKRQARVDDPVRRRDDRQICLPRVTRCPG